MTSKMVVELDPILLHTLRYGEMVDLSLEGEPHFILYSAWAEGGDRCRVGVIYVNGITNEVSFEAKTLKLTSAVIDYILSRDGKRELWERLFTKIHTRNCDKN